MGEVTLVPIVHGALAMALWARQRFLESQPTAVAVELPRYLEPALRRTVKRLPLLSVLRITHESAPPEFFLVEPCDAFVEVIRLAEENKLPWYCVDAELAGYGSYDDGIPDAYAASRIGYARYLDLVRRHLVNQPRDPSDELRERLMAYRLRELAAKHERVLFVCGAAHAGAIERYAKEPIARPMVVSPALKVEPFHLAEEASREVMSEPPFVQDTFERARAVSRETITLPDFYDMARNLFRTASEKMKQDDGEDVTSVSIERAVKFSAKQAVVRGAFAPSLAELVTAARGFHSDDFAWHVFEEGARYGFQTSNPDLLAYRVTLEELARGRRTLHFERKQKSKRRMLRLVRQRAKAPPEGFRSVGDQFCSYPPEDIALESYGLKLRAEAKGLLSSAHARVEPLCASLLDGIDLRETIRKYAIDGRLYVREERTDRGKVGAVIVVFDGEHDDHYTWTMTWQGEHEDEGDMALFATDPRAHSVGPGIGRAEYGGFLLAYPPGRMFDVMDDPEFEGAKNHAERLLLAGIGYSLERWVVYAAKRPPSARTRMLARRLGKQVLFVPLGQLSPARLRKLRVFHVLDGRNVRAHAKQYIEGQGAR